MVKDIILADSDGRELGVILDSNITVGYEWRVRIFCTDCKVELVSGADLFKLCVYYGDRIWRHYRRGADRYNAGLCGAEGNHMAGKTAV